MAVRAERYDEYANEEKYPLLKNFISLCVFPEAYSLYSGMILPYYQTGIHPPEKASNTTFFFHEDRFVLRYGKNPDLYTLSLRRSGDLKARMFIQVDGQEAVSMAKSSFGGIDFSPFADENDAMDMIDVLFDFLVEKKITSCRINGFPECYDSYAHELMESALLERGFEIDYTDTTHYLQPAGQPFDELIDPDERTHLNFARKHRWEFQQLTSEQLPEAFALIQRSKDVKGYPTTLTLEELQNNFRLFLDNFLLFGIYDGPELRAASVCIRVNENILYDISHGDNPEKRKHSSIVPLIQGLYYYARQNRYSLLDLGLSTEKGVKNEGLFNFKRKLGSAVSGKKSYLWAF